MVSGVILAAGQSSRMGRTNKLSTEWRGKPLICHVYDAAHASGLEELVVVTGHDAEKIKRLLPDARFVHNSDFQSGIAGSIKMGIAAIENIDSANGVMVMLGDMPVVSTENIDAMLSAFDGKPLSIVAATQGGTLGNPVLFGRTYFEALKHLEGDRGARCLIEQADHITKVEIGEAAVRDFDTPDRFLEP